jgi:hypothetical protein
MLGGFVIDLILAPIRALRERVEDLIERVYWMGFATGAAVAVAVMLVLWLLYSSQRRS